jgi:DNA-binding transcriptional MerR regulator
MSSTVTVQVPATLPPLWIDAKEAKRMFGASPEQLRKWTKQGKIKPSKHGRRMVRYSVRDLQKHYERNQV